MFRAILEFLALMVFFAVARSVISTMMRVAGTYSTPQAGAKQQNRDGEIRSAGELRQDPVCGTFIPIATSLKQIVNGETVYFCSASCRDKFRVKAT